jgi:hypothetical protein
VLGAIIGSYYSGMQLSSAVKEIVQGKTAEGTITTVEGSTNLFMTFAPFAKGIVVKGGLAIGGLTMLASVAAGGAVALAAEESRRAVRGEKTTAAEAVDYYANLVERGGDKGGAKGFFMKAAGYVGGSFASLIAAGQGYRGR